MADHYPGWSPDASKIVFIRVWDCCNGGTFIMNADGSGQHSITPGGFGGDAPNFSPNEQKIAYVGFGEGGYDGIYTMKVDGSDQRQLSTDGFNSDWR